VALKISIVIGKETDMEVIVSQSSVSVPKKVRVEPNVAGFATLRPALEVVVEVGVDGDQVGLELCLDTNTSDLEIKLGVFI
jgi:hypothetical protein